MREAVRHRGPDADGLWMEGQIGFGHCRLSIIDLSTAANQPMATPDGQTVIIYNGEIYNFRELRKELEAEGCRFRTRSDTEALLWGYRVWGIETLARKLDGMAAFALWDAGAKRLFLLRDRYGLKPLYIWRQPGRLSFASEIKAFMADPAFKVRLNLRALNEYFTFQNQFRTHTLFEGVELLEPGTILTVDAGGETRRRYWDFDFSTRDETITFELDYMQREATEVLPKLLDAIGFRRGVLLGHSDGASIAAIYAGSVQDHRIRGLALLAPHFFVEEFSLQEIRHAKERYDAGDLRAKLSRHHADVDNAFRGWNDAWLDPDFGSVFDIVEPLAYIRVPILIVQGEDDPYGTVRQIEVAEEECYCPVDAMLLPGCGHAPTATSPRRRWRR